MTRWAARLPFGEQLSLARLRCHTGLQCAVVDDAVWITGLDQEKLRDEVRRALPAADHFDVLAGDELRIFGHRVPHGYLPQVTWREIATLVDVTMPPSRLAGRCEFGATLQFVRSHEMCEPTALLTTIDRWAAYAARAPEVRLRQWRFAACADRRVLIAGIPLPPISGERFVIADGIAAPAGLAFAVGAPHEGEASAEPKIQPTGSTLLATAVIAEAFHLQPDDVVILRPGHDAERINCNDFASASRSAVRQTAEGLNHVLNS